MQLADVLEAHVDDVKRHLLDNVLLHLFEALVFGAVQQDPDDDGLGRLGPPGAEPRDHHGAGDERHDHDHGRVAQHLHNVPKIIDPVQAADRLHDESCYELLPQDSRIHALALISEIEVTKLLTDSAARWRFTSLV